MPWGTKVPKGVLFREEKSAKSNLSVAARHLGPLPGRFRPEVALLVFDDWESHYSPGDHWFKECFLSSGFGGLALSPRLMEVGKP